MRDCHWLKIDHATLALDREQERALQIHARHTRCVQFNWLLALLPLLLAAALTVPLLAVDAYNGDEPASLLPAGINRSGPLSLVDVWSSVNARQALGWPTLLAIWGRLVGWSEVAVRALPLFAGCLTLAWVYRIGRDLLAPRAGLLAALLLSTSVFFLSYMIHARSFTLVSLFTTLSIWSYWRMVLHPRSPGRAAQAGLVLGSASLLYMHYFCALFLPVLGLFHLIFVPRNRRWWQTVYLLVLATLLAMLQLPGFLQGLNDTADKESLHNRALPAPELVSHFVRNLTNGLIDPSPPLNVLLLISLTLALLLVVPLRLRGVIRINSLWLLAITSLGVLALMIAINEIGQVIVDNRIRYLMPLWPLVALLVGAGLWHLASKHRRLVAALLALWLITGVWLTLATEFRYETGFFFHSDFHRFIRAASEHVPASELLIMDFEVVNRNERLVNARNLDGPWDTLYRYREDPYETIRPVHTAYPFLWLLYRTKDRVSVADLPHELGRVFCERALDEWGLILERYALHSVENCPDRPVHLQFDRDIQLTAPEITLLDGLMRLDAHFRSEDDYLLSRYSLAVHVVDQSGERVAQGDTGVGPGAIVPLRSEIDVSTLPRGEYELRVALYDWQTGERLNARDPETDEVSDIHTLLHFRID